MNILSPSPGILLFHFTLHEFRLDGGERKVRNNRNWLHHGKYFMLAILRSLKLQITSFCLQVVMTLVSIPLMDKTGRRTLHLYGLGGMFIFSIFITISFLIKASIRFSI
jgi:Sugar (and other) transporter